MRVGAALGVRLTLLVALGAVAHGCRCGGAMQLESDLCEAACGAAVGSGCERAGLAPEDLSACVVACRSHGDLRRRARCGQQWESYARCVAGARLDCTRASADAWTEVERGSAWRDCQREAERFGACQRRCEGAGRVHVRRSGAEAGAAARSLEVERMGCADCDEGAQRGAPHGSPCADASVCRAACCECPGGPARFTARLCEAGRCVGGESVCTATAGLVQSCGAGAP